MQSMSSWDPPTASSVQLNVPIHERELNLPARFYDTEDDEHPQHECGIFAIYTADERASTSIFFALHALQHRGQEMAGIATCHGGAVHVHKGMGLVSQIFTEEHMKMLSGPLGIGHTRYSTAGGKSINNAQPFVLETALGRVSVAHNGQLTRQRFLRKLLLGRGTGLFTHSDSEILAQMLAHPASTDNLGSSSPNSYNPSPSPMSPTKGKNPQYNGKSMQSPHIHKTQTVALDDSNVGYNGLVTIHQYQSRPGVHSDPWIERIVDLLRDAEGAYALCVMVPGAIYGCRDRYGIRPLCLGAKKTDNGVSYALSSESCAFGPIGFSYVREIAPGEIVRLNDKGAYSTLGLSFQTEIKPALCVFEYVYFARPDSFLEDKQVHHVRQRFGRVLAEEDIARNPIKIDVVAGVPDSSIAAAIGYSMRSGVTFMEVLCKNRYIGRTFIQPDQAMRENSIRLKFNPLSQNLVGRSILLVDDSLVRGNTLKQLIPLLKSAGAKEVHIRISSPVLRHPCYMGVDIGTYDEILATHVKSVESMCTHIGADSLEFLTPSGMMRAIRDEYAGHPERVGPVDKALETTTGYCTACFTGEYPLELDIEDAAHSMNRGKC